MNEMLLSGRTQVGSRLREFQAWWSVPHRQIATSLVRIALGVITLLLYGTHLKEIGFLWGNDGVVPFNDFVTLMHLQHSFSLYQLSAGPNFTYLVYGLGILITLAFTAGWFSRISSILFFIFTWSLYGRNPFLLDGGDNLLYLLAFFIMFTRCGTYFSIDAALGKENVNRQSAGPFVSQLHNFAVLGMILQICLLYFTSAFYKTQGHMWEDGTALYYILKTYEFDLSPIAHLFWRSDVLVTLLTLATIVFQWAFPFLIWNRKVKWIMFAGALCLHASIGYFMGLVLFSSTMIASELLLFGDDSYLKVERMWHVLQSRWAMRTSRSTSALVHPAAED